MDPTRDLDLAAAGPDPAAATAVLLPGSGSDGDFVRRAFAPVAERCARVVAVDAAPPSVVDGYLAALEAARGRGPVVACGVSLGAAVAARWAAGAPAATGALVLALAPWCGEPGDAPAALAAQATADAVDVDGAQAAIAAMQAGSPPWLARELTRSWAAHGAFLAAALREAGAYRGPTVTELGRVTMPTVVIGARGDAVHPEAVAAEWAAALPSATHVTVDLAELGTDATALGRAAVQALGWDPRR
ncbi:serine aminopeptidase domain-containing protein [Tsukamurella soli]|uniref:serine aminopeptidase domain-containing protein n=1 Tax=Tsukamurella soli TaxID=644556 RepID=UPI0036174B45